MKSADDILREQLELLADRSKHADADQLQKLTSSMCEIVTTVSNAHGYNKPHQTALDPIQ